MLHPIHAYIVDLEALRQIEIDLGGGTLPRPSQGILKADIDLWAIKYPLPWVYPVREFEALESHL